MRDLLQDLRFGLRGLARRPGFTAVAVTTLALGVGSSTAMFSVVHAVLLRPLPFPDAQRILRVEERHDDGATLNLTGSAFRRLHERSRSFASLAVYRSYPFNLSAPDIATSAVTATRVSADFFGVLATEAALGRLFAAADFLEGSEPVALLSERVFSSWAGADPHLLGRHVRLDGRPHVVVGIVPTALGFPEDTDVWLPMDEARSLPHNGRSHLFTTLARLRGDAPLVGARSELAAIAEALRGEAPEDALAGLVATPLHERLTASVRPALLALFGAVGLLLVISCVNLAHLLLARGLARSREIAVRSALGAGRLRLARQLVTENLALAALAVVPSVGWAVVSTRALLPLLPADLPRLGEISVDVGALGFALAVSALAALVFGLAPILATLRADLRSPLADGGRSVGSRGSRARSGLVAAEVTLVVMLTTAAGLLARTFLSLQAVPLGFRTAGVLSLYVSPAGEQYDSAGRVVAFADRVLDDLRRLPGAERVAASSTLPTHALPSTSFGLEGRSTGDTSNEPGADVLAVSPDYFRLMDIPLLRGRAPESGDTLDMPVIAVLSRTAAERFWPQDDPLGRRLTLLHWDEPLEATVVGVVEDVRQRGPEEPVEPAVYYSHAQFADRVLGWHFLVRNASDPNALALPAQKVVRDIDPGQAPTGVATLEQTLASALAQRRFSALLVLLFAGAALALAGAGIQGVVAYVVTQRTREIGVRLALGATRGDVVREMATHALRPAALGGVVGLATGRALSSLLHGVASTDMPTLALTSVALVGVVGLAAWLPARRAAKVDPLVALRSE